MYSYPHKTAYRPIDAALVKTHLNALSGSCSLYLHIPFCQAKCGYCNLFSVVANEPLINSYINAVERQCDQLAGLINRSDITFDSLILGGGTPSILEKEHLSRLFLAIARSFSLSLSDIQAEIEVAPNQASEQLLLYLKEAGFDRVSIGVQSFHSSELCTLGRIHSPKACETALAQMKKIGFKTINSDLIYGLPGQTTTSLLYSLEKLLTYMPDEIFLYPLYIKPQTPLFGKLELNQEQAIELYRFARDKLQQAGYTQLSMRRFTLSPPVNEAEGCGFEQGLSIGCGGRSYLGALHICEPYRVRQNDCTALLKSFCDKTDFTSGLSGLLLNEDEQKRRYFIKNILYHGGLSISDYNRRFNRLPQEDSLFFKLSQKISSEISELITINDGRLTLTAEGLARSDQIGPMLISPSVARLTAEGRF